MAESFFALSRDDQREVLKQVRAKTDRLTHDYANMRADQVMLGEVLSFDHLMQACSEVETQANKAAVP